MLARDPDTWELVAYGAVGGQRHPHLACNHGSASHGQLFRHAGEDTDMYTPGGPILLDDMSEDGECSCLCVNSTPGIRTVLSWVSN